VIPCQLIDFCKNTRNLDDSYNLVIIGGGLAGLTAAFESYLKSNYSLKIAVMEQLSNIGGNSNKATSGINLLETEPQKKQNISDNYTIFYYDTMKSGKYINDPSLVSTLINGTKTLYDYYTKNFGMDITLLGILGGHSVARTHRPTDSNNVIGSYLIKKVSEKINNIINIKILYNSKVTQLLKNENNNSIYGLKYIKVNESIENIINCDAIILASGGYGHDFGDKGLLKEFAPEYMNFPTTNGENTTGSGIKLGREIGAGLVDMKQVQIHPTGFVNPRNRYEKKKFLAPELLRGVGGILINENGERFCNELGTRDYVTKKIIENCKKQNTREIDQYESYLLMNQDMANEFGNNFYFYKNVQGFISEHKNFSELAKDINVDYSKLSNTIYSYNNAYEKKIDEFNKTEFKYKFNLDETVYSMIITPSIHYTMGGLKMNNKGEILNPENKTIYGLYGAGEVTGGVHGGNRLGGNSLAECGVYGRISADSAVEYLFNKYNNNPNNIHKFFGKTKSSKGLGVKGIISIIILIVFALISLF
jgi:flavocytochrome c